MQGADNTEELVGILDGIEGRRFAVVDAAQIENLQELLREAGLPFHPLYLDEKDPPAEFEVAGPHLVELPTRGSARKLLALADGKPAIVWWVWPDEGEGTTTLIYNHLRRLNVAELPAQEETSLPPPPDADTHQDGHIYEHSDHIQSPRRTASPYWEAVVFRHTDPDVMALLLPLLDARQVVRLFGDALLLVVDAQQQAQVKRFLRPASLPEKPKGWLRITQEQYQRLALARANMVIARVVKYLQRVAPGHVATMSTEELAHSAGIWFNEASEFGVSATPAHCRWAYMQLLAKGRLSTEPTIKRMFSVHDPQYDADQRVKILLRSLIEEAEDLV